MCETHKLVYDRIRQFVPKGLTGVIHCFLRVVFLKKNFRLQFYISFSGIVTFKNAVALQDVAK